MSSPSIDLIGKAGDRTTQGRRRGDRAMNASSTAARLAFHGMTAARWWPDAHRSGVRINATDAEAFARMVAEAARHMGIDHAAL